MARRHSCSGAGRHGPVVRAIPQRASGNGTACFSHVGSSGSSAGKPWVPAQIRATGARTRSHSEAPEVKACGTRHPLFRHQRCRQPACGVNCRAWKMAIRSSGGPPALNYSLRHMALQPQKFLERSLAPAGRFCPALCRLSETPLQPHPPTLPTSATLVCAFGMFLQRSMSR